jgi:formate hydrogenlyase subunit 3/multisubunit Na+/H+ antiporter MnhD subunit
VAAWRYSFLADWGLALVGIGVVVPDGYAAAYLVLASILLVRFPLYLWARPVLLGRAEPAMGPANLLLAAALAGAAPFAGFAVRVLLLRAATQVYWPLALVLAAGMLVWLAHSFRLARTIGAPRGRAAVGVVLALAFSVLLGVAPAVLFAMGDI